MTNPMTKTYRFTDSSSKLVEVSDEKNNHWTFMLDDETSIIRNEWFNTEPRPNIKPYVN